MRCFCLETLVSPNFVSYFEFPFFYNAPGDDTLHGGILLLLCPYVHAGEANHDVQSQFN